MYIFLENKVLIPSKNIILIIDYIHVTNEENKGFYEKQLAEKTLSWINRHDDIRQTINADLVLQSFYSSLSPENRQTPFR